MKKVRRMYIVLVIILLVIAFGTIGLAGFFYNNTHYNLVIEKRVLQAGYECKQVQLNNGEIINYAEGPNNGPALLLIHGQTVTWEDYGKVLPDLAKQFHVYAVDCFGHGSSSHTLELYTCEANSMALVWFIDNIIQDKCYLSGHSSGGIMAAWIAANQPSKIEGLILEDPPLFHVTPEEIQEGKGAFAWYDAYTVTHNFTTQNTVNDFPIYYLQNSYLLTIFGGLQEKIVQSAMNYRVANPDKPIQISWVPYTWLRPLLYMDDYDPLFGNAFYDGSWMAGIDQSNILSNIQCPVIYIKAETQYGKDGILYAANTDEDANKINSLIPNCERIDIKSGHDIHFEHPDVFVSACKKILLVNDN